MSHSGRGVKWFLAGGVEWGSNKKQKKIKKGRGFNQLVYISINICMGGHAGYLRALDVFHPYKCSGASRITQTDPAKKYKKTKKKHIKNQKNQKKPKKNKKKQKKN